MTARYQIQKNKLKYKYEYEEFDIYCNDQNLSLRCEDGKTCLLMDKLGNSFQATKTGYGYGKKDDVWRSLVNPELAFTSFGGYQNFNWKNGYINKSRPVAINSLNDLIMILQDDYLIDVFNRHVNNKKINKAKVMAGLDAIHDDWYVFVKTILKSHHVNVNSEIAARISYLKFFISLHPQLSNNQINDLFKNSNMDDHSDFRVNISEYQRVYNLLKDQGYDKSFIYSVWDEEYKYREFRDYFNDLKEKVWYPKIKKYASKMGVNYLCPPLWAVKELHSLVNKWATTKTGCNEKSNRGLNSPVEQTWEDRIKKGLKHHGDFKLLTTPSRLRSEGRQQKHCIGRASQGYVNSVVNKEAIAFHFCGVTYYVPLKRAINSQSQGHIRSNRIDRIGSLLVSILKKRYRILYGIGDNQIYN